MGFRHIVLPFHHIKFSAIFVDVFGSCEIDSKNGILAQKKTLDIQILSAEEQFLDDERKILETQTWISTKMAAISTIMDVKLSNSAC